MPLSKAEKKACRQNYKEARRPQFLLDRAQAEALFEFLEAQLDASPCDETLRFAAQWLTEQLPQQKDAVLQELRDMGGRCDCEVLLNCYESYDLYV